MILGSPLILGTTGYFPPLEGCFSPIDGTVSFSDLVILSRLFQDPLFAILELIRQMSGNDGLVGDRFSNGCQLSEKDRQKFDQNIGQALALNGQSVMTINNEIGECVAPILRMQSPG